MSTILAVRRGESVVIAAETLTTVGYVHQSADYIANHSKLVPVGEGFVGAVGHASWDLILRDWLAAAEEPPRLDSTAAIFSFAVHFHEVLKERYFVNPKEEEGDPFESSQLELIIANPHGIFGLCSLRSVLEYRRFHAIGSGYRFALGAMHAVYEAGAGAIDVAQAGLRAAVEFDEASGGAFEIHEFTLQAPADG